MYKDTLRAGLFHLFLWATYLENTAWTAKAKPIFSPVHPAQMPKTHTIARPNETVHSRPKPIATTAKNQNVMTFPCARSEWSGFWGSNSFTSNARLGEAKIFPVT